MKPLAERRRPYLLKDFIGQEHLLGEEGVLRKLIVNGNITSLVLWGPPGVGKTTLANIIANETKKNIRFLNAISAGVSDIREVITYAKSIGGGCILFIDEIHRFNKSQQDVLLGAVEKGLIILIGATTENPSFEVNAALLSRCQVLTLYSLQPAHLRTMIETALEQDEILSTYQVTINEWEALISIADGDGRKALNAIELLINTHTDKNIPLIIDNQYAKQVIQQNILQFDKSGESHYNTISAFIKSVRGSDVNASIYYLARMLAGGEKPEFIARRLVILSAEDIGLANPNALLIANACFDAIHKIGMPEARIVLSECTIYLASSPKSNAAYLAIDAALAEVKKSGNLPIPLHLRNGVTPLMKSEGYGLDYEYPHDFENQFIHKEYLPEALSGKVFYEPKNNPKENEIKKFLHLRWKGKYRY